MLAPRDEVPRVQAYATDLAELVERARSLAAREGRTLLGITGPPGVGKSTLAQLLVDEVGPCARCLGMDGFHLSKAALSRLGRLDRMGAIDTFDAAGFLAMVRRLRTPSEETVHAPEFCRKTEESIADALQIEPQVRLVVVEGNYLLVPIEPWSQMRDLLDQVWYCDCEQERRLCNLIARHRAYGKTAEQARDWALGLDQRNAELIAQTKPRADLIAIIDRGEGASRLQGSAASAPPTA